MDASKIIPDWNIGSNFHLMMAVCCISQVIHLQNFRLKVIYKPMTSKYPLFHFSLTCNLLALPCPSTCKKVNLCVNVNCTDGKCTCKTKSLATSKISYKATFYMFVMCTVSCTLCMKNKVYFLLSTNKSCSLPMIMVNSSTMIVTMVIKYHTFITDGNKFSKKGR